MKLTITLVLLVLAITLMSARSLWLSFRAQRPADYAATEPAFDIRQILNGPIVSEGLVYGPTGRMTSSFVARMHGDWQGDRGTLTEDFTYSNGSVQRRKWFLQAGPGNTFTATADDIVGEGRGVMSGATVMLRYRIRLPEEAGGHVLDATDWMYLMEDGTVMNRSEMRKFGIQVAELIATMRPAPAEQDHSIAAE